MKKIIVLAVALAMVPAISHAVTPEEQYVITSCEEKYAGAASRKMEKCDGDKACMTKAFGDFAERTRLCIVRNGSRDLADIWAMNALRALSGN